MCDQGHVERSPRALRQHLLELDCFAFAPGYVRGDSESLHHAPYVRIDRTRVAPQSIEHDASRGLPSYPWQARQVALHLLIAHGVQAAEVQFPLSRFDGLEYCLNLARLRWGKTCIHEQSLNVVHWRIHHNAPGRHLPPQGPIGTDVLHFLRHSREHQENQVIQRVGRVVVTRLSVLRTETAFDFAKPFVLVLDNGAFSCFHRFVGALPSRH